MKIKVEKPERKKLEELKVDTWSIWEHESARFDWHYDQTEECYFLEGHVIVETEDGQKVEVKKGDFAVFPKGLSCVWDIKLPIRKHYNLKGD